MAMTIQGIEGGLALKMPDAVREKTEGTDKVDFSDVLSQAFDRASESEKTADSMSQRFSQGDPQVGIHEVMISAEKAQISLRYAVTLKNKMIEAYRELMNTPI